MTQNTAISWWNSVMVSGNGPPSALRLPTRHEMAQICRELVPVVHAELDFGAGEDQFWKDLQSLMENVTKIKPFPDPVSNFPVVVLYFYTLKELLKPRTVETCCLYASQFCPERPGDFFVNKFLLVVNSPEMAIKCMLELHEQKNRKFMVFIQEHGMASRIFDLFLTYIGNDQSVEVTQYTTKLLYYIAAELPKSETRCTLATSLFNAVALAMEASSDMVNLNLVRYFTGAADLAIVSDTLESCEFYIKKIFVYIQKPSMCRRYILEWLFHNTNRVKVTGFIYGFNKMMNYDYLGYDFLERIAEEIPAGEMVAVISCFARVMIQNKVWARTAGHVLAKLLAKKEPSHKVREWFALYIKYCFMMIKYAFTHSKYRARALIWLTVIAGDGFMRIEWVNSLVKENARACFGKKTRFLKRFIGDMQDAVPVQNAEWNEMYETCTGGKYHMKYFPFKGDTTVLVNAKKKGMKKKNPADRIAAFNFRKFVYTKTDGNSVDQQTVMFELQNFMEKEQKILQSVRGKKNIAAVCETVHRNHRMMAIGCEQCISEIASEIRKIKQKLAERFIEVCSDILAAMEKNSEVYANTEKLIEYYARLRKQDPKIPALLARKKMLMLAVQNAQRAYREHKEQGGDADSLRHVLKVQGLFPILDATVSNWIDQSSLAPVMDGVVRMIVANVGKSLVPTLDAIVAAIIKEIDVESTSEVWTRLYNSLVRILFNKAYIVAPSILCQYEAESTDFLGKCQILRKKFQSLGFSANLQSLCYYSNPNDIANLIHSALEVTRTTNYDKVMITSTIIVRSAPCNIVSIYRFMEIWISVIKDPVVVESVQLFIKACSVILHGIRE